MPASQIVSNSLIESLTHYPFCDFKIPVGTASSVHPSEIVMGGQKWNTNQYKQYNSASTLGLLAVFTSKFKVPAYKRI